MQSKILNLLCFFICIIINELHGQLYNKNKSIWSNLLGVTVGTANFFQQNIHYINQEIPEISPDFGDVYDFIVIGAGTAGATLAARLSEISEVKILLIEAGFHESLIMDIPFIALMLQMNDNINWNYRVKPSNKYCLGMKSNSCAWPAARVLGGGSVLNYMIATRGAAEDYNRWAEMGNEGWAYKDVLKYFKKLETIEIPELKSDTMYHGTDGPVHITQTSFYTPLAKTYLEAGKELGYPIVDFNGRNEIGFSYMQTTIMNGTRMSSNRAYLHPIRNRKNLYVTLRSTVTKVLIERTTNRAIGVEFIKNGRIIRVYATKEVILSAGAIKSPQLLMLSGIGPAKHLTELGIDVVQDVPVGKNLMDHIVFFGLSWMINSSKSLQTFELLNPLNPYVADFLLERKGPLTLPSDIEVISFINTEQPEKRDGLPNIELMFISNAFKEEYLIPKAFKFKKYLRNEWSKYDGLNGFIIAIVLPKPKSRGRIKLLANDINVKPEIVANYFDDPYDVKTMISGIRAAINITETKAMQKLNPKFMKIFYSMCNKYEYNSDAYWECALRTIGSTIYHYSGTCKMGARSDPTAVVDPRLKVIGIRNLRVADASIIPEITSAHINIPIYMIGEKAADMIKEDWGYLKK